MRFVIFLSVLFLSLSAQAVEMSEGEKKIAAEIKKANYCQVDDDCTVTRFGCPFGCSSYVNKGEVSRIAQMIVDLRKEPPMCEYKCGIINDLPVCKENKCVSGKKEIDRVFEVYSCKEIKNRIKRAEILNPRCEQDKKSKACVELADYKVRYIKKCLTREPF